MKSSKTLLFLLLLFLGDFVCAQEADFDSYMIKQQALRCEDVALNSSVMFVDYIARSETDSAKMILSYWETKCRYSEATFRANVLLAIQEGCYNDDVIKKADALSQIINFKVRVNLAQSEDSEYYFARYPQSYSYLSPECEFDVFTRIWATTLMARQDTGSIEYLWCELFTGKTDRIISELNKKPKEESPNLIEPVKQAVKYANGGLGFNIAFIAGVWVPTGEASLLGIHPEIGFQMGGRRRNFFFDVTDLFRFLPSKEPYLAMRYGKFEKTKRFALSMYFGLDIGYVVYSKKGHELAPIAGIGFDFFECFKEDKKNNEPTISADSYNVNVGIGYKYFFGEIGYFGLNAKYNFVDYKRSKIVDFTGNTITLEFLIGGLSFNQNRKGLKNWLDY